jgi:hypothetical protein
MENVAEKAREFIFGELYKSEYGAKPLPGYFLG